MATITERELLAFANMMNLRWEFVDLGKRKTDPDKDGKYEILEYYTIKELLDKEYLSIMEDIEIKGTGKTKLKRRAFYNLENEDNLELKNLR